ncbi:MAG: glycosyltransferase family 9 protein [Candidatus Undinarchaeales archaeon]|jgi:lipopolysaccharide heptosyltransferase II|nr:glycosyltransferase family 9 protein [Candidatus Undinarchaeales archaeon]
MKNIKKPLHVRIFDNLIGIDSKGYDLLFKKRKPVTGPFKNILVINLMGLGNMIFTVPMLKTIKKNWPEAKITLLASYKPVVELMEANKGLVDDIVMFDVESHKGIFKKIKFMRSLKDRKFDLSILTHPSGKFSGMAAFFTRIKNRAGASQKVGMFNTGVYQNIVANSNKKHCVEVNLDILRQIGITIFEKSIKLELPAENIDTARKLLKIKGLSENQKLIGVHTGSVPETWYKQWTQHGFAEACTELGKKHNAKIMIIGGPEEETAGKSIHSMMQEKPMLFFDKTIPETAALIKNCDVFISADTGPGHLASALGVPVVSIFGPTDSEKAKPYGEKVIVVQSEVDCCPCVDSFTANYLRCKERKCLTGLEPGKVVEAVNGLI